MSDHAVSVAATPTPTPTSGPASAARALRPARRPASLGQPTPLPELLRQRIPALDGVRGLAIVLVLMHQFNIMDPQASLPLRLLTATVEPGWIGVQLFFVLSGFLITGILLDAKNSQSFFGPFYRRRLQRIFPLYYLVLAVTFLVLPRLTTWPASMLGAGHDHLRYWLYLQNWPIWHSRGVGLLGHTWSLAVEEQYYLVWPLAVWALTQRGLVRLSLAIVAGAFLLRVVLRATGVAPELIYSSTVTRADALAMGGLVAIAARRADGAAWLRRHLDRWTVLLIAALAVVTVASHALSRKQIITQTFGYSILALAFAVLIAWAVLQSTTGASRLVAWLSWRPLRAVGRVSYGMYLFHLPLHLYVTRVLLASTLDGDGATPNLALAAGYFFAASLVVFVLAQLSWSLFEKRLLAWSPRQN
jgi:peptidoglycan/LPS O-acetylase OafA/YrhL